MNPKKNKIMFNCKSLCLVILIENNIMTASISKFERISRNGEWGLIGRQFPKILLQSRWIACQEGLLRSCNELLGDQQGIIRTNGFVARKVIRYERCGPVVDRYFRLNLPNKDTSVICMVKHLIFILYDFFNPPCRTQFIVNGP